MELLTMVMADGAGDPGQQWRIARPAPGVPPCVERYVGYRSIGSPALHRGVPSRHMTFVVAIGPGIDVVAHTNPAQAPHRYRAVLSGLQPSSALIAHDGVQEGVAIEMSPLGCRELFGLPASALWDTSVELADLIGPAGIELWERLQTTGTWEERFAVCDAVLSGAAVGGAPSPALARGWRLLVRSGGRLSVGDLAADTGYTRQHLTRLFRAEFGAGPKLAARIIRFDRAKHLMERSGGDASFGRVAVASGYADQAHLNREVAALAGCTPTALLAGDVPFVQDRPAPPGHPRVA